MTKLVSTVTKIGKEDEVQHQWQRFEIEKAKKNANKSATTKQFYKEFVGILAREKFLIERMIKGSYSSYNT